MEDTITMRALKEALGYIDFHLRFEATVELRRLLRAAVAEQLALGHPLNDLANRKVPPVLKVYHPVPDESPKHILDKI